jgi:hypothetical protein
MQLFLGGSGNFRSLFDIANLLAGNACTNKLRVLPVLFSLQQIDATIKL